MKKTDNCASELRKDVLFQDPITASEISDAFVTEWKGMLNYCINGDSAIYVACGVGTTLSRVKVVIKCCMHFYKLFELKCVLAVCVYTTTL